MASICALNPSVKEGWPENSSLWTLSIRHKIRICYFSTNNLFIILLFTYDFYFKISMAQLFLHFIRGLKTVYLTFGGIFIVATHIKESQPSKNVGSQFACSKNGVGVGSMTWWRWRDYIVQQLKKLFTFWIILVVYEISHWLKTFVEKALHCLTGSPLMYFIQDFSDTVNAFQHISLISFRLHNWIYFSCRDFNGRIL